MAERGTLEKMLILAFDRATDAETGGRSDAKQVFEALINPENYTLEYKVKTADAQGQGTGGSEVKFEYTLPEELSFEFLFDNTGLIDGDPKPDGVAAEVNKFREMLMGFQPDSHQPYHLKLVWGELLFTCRAIEIGITHKMFNPDGKPIRSVVKVKFKKSVEETRRAASEDRRSPDLTQRRVVRPGDTLPLLCHQVYGDPRHYLRVAEYNDLDGFRSLTVGTALLFPPIREGVNGR